MNKEKLIAYQQLALKRKADARENLSKEYLQPEDLDPHWQQFDLISPLQKSALNLDSDLMIILQDWNSFDPNPSAKKIKHDENLESIKFERENGYFPTVRTNINLDKLLKDHFRLKRSDIYITNLFVFIKIGSKSGPIPPDDLKYSASEYTLEEIDIVKPKMILCLGAYAFNSLRSLISSEKFNWRDSLDYPIYYKNSVIYAVSHTTQQAINSTNRGGVDRVNGMWNELAKRFDKLKSSDQKNN